MGVFNITYKLKIENKEVFAVIPLHDIESNGVTESLIKAGIIIPDTNFLILERSLTMVESGDIKSGPPNYGNYYKRYGGKPDVLSRPFHARVESVDKYKVNLHSVPFFKNDKFPKSVEIEAPTRGIAIMTAMKNLGVMYFPEGWKNMDAEKM